MAQYKSKPVTVGFPAEFIAEKFGDLTVLGNAVERLGDAEREKLGDITFNKDSIKMDTKQVGTIEFKVVERTADRVTMKAMGSPIELLLVINLKAQGEHSTQVETVIDVDIPVMLRPMVSGPLQKAVDQIGDLLAKSLGK